MLFTLQSVPIKRKWTNRQNNKNIFLQKKKEKDG